MKVSCICPTWNRPNWLGEAVESFHRQDYKGEKELIIINDVPNQTLVYDHPEVKVINKPEKYKSLGAKYNDAFFNLSSGDVLTPWEDDDIFLPHKLSRGMSEMQKHGADYYKLGRAYFWNNGNVTEICDNLFWCAAFYSRDLLDKMGGCSETANAAADQSIEKHLKKFSGNHVYDNSKNAEDIYYIYRWAGTGAHISGIPEGPNNMAEFQKLVSKNMVTGNIELHSHWSIDYTEQCRKYREEKGI